jgi:CHAT domain-containing protein
MQFDELPASRREAQTVASLWQQFGRLDNLNDGDSRVLLGANATEGAFKRLGPGRRILHIATHGFFLSDSCASAVKGTRSVGGLVQVGSTVAARPNAAGTMPGRATLPQNPLLLSGLAMAGANRHGASGPAEDDGILTAEEVAALNLDGVEWAVLSACDTGLGTVAAGEGVFGLRRAFQVAGVHTVIMSLWSVDDKATQQWMEALYRARLSQHLDTADSVRQASLTLLRERRAKGQNTNPFYWAGFVAAGDWR